MPRSESDLGRLSSTSSLTSTSMSGAPTRSGSYSMMNVNGHGDVGSSQEFERVEIVKQLR
jgi:hypothetical protein